MRPADWRHAIWSLALWLGWAAAAPALDPHATAPSLVGPTLDAPSLPPIQAPTVDPPADPDEALQHALLLERRRDWSAAIAEYEEALERWPSRTDFRHRLRLCELHYKLARRYQDRSFRAVLLKLPRDRALALFDELIERIQTHYVDDVEVAPLLRHGLDNLEVALRDPVYLRTNAPGASADRVLWLRDAFARQRAQIVARTRAEARAQVEAACALGQQALGLEPAAVILEFVYGTCDALDDYTCYLTPDKLDDLYAMIDGNFVGLGIELKLDEEGLRLVGVIRGGPAWDAQLKVGDRITHVAERVVRGLSLDEAAGLLQGEADSPVAITILRRDGSSQCLNLVRRPVEVDSVAQARIVDPSAGIGYIQLTGFQKTSTEELERAIAALQSRGMRHLVLDLRGNPGGLLNVAVDMADRFLGQGVIVSTRGRAPGQSYVYRARAQPEWRMPLSVLIDGDSASASEILAGALKEHHRATIVGERSYGKGSVQSIFTLRTVPAGLKLTTAKFYSPANRPYSEQGVEPDLQARSAARPASFFDDTTPDLEPGDPEHDPVLALALQHAKRQPNAAR